MRTRTICSVPWTTVKFRVSSQTVSSSEERISPTSSLPHLQGQLSDGATPAATPLRFRASRRYR